MQAQQCLYITKQLNTKKVYSVSLIGLYVRYQTRPYGISKADP